MQITTNELDYCKLEFHCEETDVDAIAEKRNEIVGKFKNHKVPGFRNGKATPDAIKFNYKSQIKDSLVQQLAEDAYQSALAEKNVQPFGQPQFTSYQLEGNKFSCVFTLHTMPTFELSQYKEFEIPKMHSTETSDEISQKILQDLRVKFGTTNEYTDDEFVQMTDNIIISYAAFIGDEKIDRLTADNETVIVGKTPIPGFDDQLLGMKKGEERSFIVQMPKELNDYLAGKDIKFDVKLVLGAKITPAPLDEELAKKIGVQSLQMVMDGCKSSADNRIADNESSYYFGQISNRLVSGHEFKVPAWLTNAESQFAAKRQGEDWEKLADIQKEAYVVNAEKSIKLSLVLNQVRNEMPEACLTQEETMNMLKDNLKRISNEPEKAMQEVYQSGQMSIMMNRIKDDYTLAAIKKTCTIVE